MTAEPLPRPVDPGTVDADNPWPGLASFREADRELFFGRELETQELLRLVLRERLTVLFGLSGLGKTSLLRAGLFPLLRQENVLPVYVRLDFSEEREGTLAGQVRQAIVREAAGIEAPSFPASETLWESLHRQGAELWSPRNRIVTPLLVFDQFEEVFTLGRRNAARAEETEAFLAELADLCEGSVPAEVRERLEADPSATREFSFTRHPYKILLSLREDFLPELESLRGRIRSIVQNRFRLRRMNGDNALRVVTQAGGRLVEPDAPDRIVRFVAGRESDSTVLLAELEIEPALLSVVCRELNNKRRAQGLPRITAGLVSGNRDEILSELYERSVNDLGPDVRSFVEERLLTKSGFRDTVALENAVELPGVTREALDKLTDRRLLRIEDRGGQQRLELTHDVLTGVIRKSRDLRREREAGEKAGAERREADRKLRRSRLVIALLALVLIGVVALAAWGLAAQRKAREALAGSDVGRALNLRESNPAHALAHLARALRSEPESVPAQSLLTDLLLYSSWPRPVSELRLADAASVSLSEDGRLFAAVTESGRVRLWDTRTLQQVGEIKQSAAVESLDISRDGRRILVLSPGSAQLWDTRIGRSLRRFELGERSRVLLSPDGRWLAWAPGDQTLTLTQVGTGLEHKISFPYYPPELALHGGYENLGFSPNSRTIFAHDNLQILLWDVDSGKSLPAPPAGVITESVSFSPDSRRLLISGDTTTLWDAGAPVSFGGEATQAWLSPTGERVVTYDRREAKLRIWRTRELQAPQAEIPKRNLLRAELSRDGELLLTTSQEGVELWDSDTGRPIGRAFCDCVDGRFLAGTRQIVTADDSGILRVWSPEPFQTGTELPDRPMNTGFDRHGGRLAIHDSERAVHIWDTDGVRPVGAPIPGVERFRLSSDGRFLLATRGDVLQLWETGSSRPVWRPVQLSPNPWMTLSPEKAILALAAGDSTILLRSLADGRQVGAIRQDQKIDQFTFSPGGDRLVTAFEKGDLRTWDSRTGKPLGRLMDHESLIFSFDFSSDGKLIATGTKKGLVRIWDLHSGTLLVGPLRHRFGVGSVQFRHADRLLLTRAKNLLRLWDTRTGEPVGGIIRVTGEVEDAQLSPDGARILVVVRQEPTLHLLDARTGETLVRIPRPSSDLRARFSPSGQLLWIASEERVDVRAVPHFPKEDRELLARWAEAVSGWTLDAEGRLVEIQDQLARLEGLRRETAEAPPGQLGAASLIRWFLSDPKTRTPSPVIGATSETIPE